MKYKKIIYGIMATVLISTMSLAGCQSNSYSDENTELNSNIDSVSYAYGYIVGKNFNQDDESKIDPKLFAEGMNIAFSGDSSKFPPINIISTLRYNKVKNTSKKKSTKKHKRTNMSYIFGFAFGLNLKNDRINNLNTNLFEQGMGIAFSGDTSIISLGKMTNLLKHYQVKIHQILKNRNDSVSYAFGYVVGKNLIKSGMGDISTNLFNKGMEVVYSGKPSLIEPLKSQIMLRKYQMKAKSRTQDRQKMEAIENKRKGQVFLSKNNNKAGVITTNSGLEYKILKEGNGASPTKNDVVIVNYVGKHLNGKIFDQMDHASISLENVIFGWQEGLQLMKEGATFKFWIPGNLGYGAHPRPTGKIEPNETLVFKIHLIKVK